MSENGSSPSGDPMRYAVAGGEMPTTAEALEKYTGRVDWGYLRPHFEAGVLFYVDPDLELSEVGEAVANDARDRVEAWLQAGDLLMPGELHAQHWADVRQEFVALVVSPFVLAQPAGARNDDG